jgi:hypothetical protein
MNATTQNWYGGMKMKRILWFLIFLVLTGCAAPLTTFTGDPKIKEGPSGCEAKCNAWGMELVGMVALGEYTEGCICKKKGSELSMQDIGETLSLSLGGLGGGAVAAVESERRDREARAAAAGVFVSAMHFH